MDKREYYSRPEVVARYEDWRFGSAGGRYVDELERGIVLELLREVPRDADVLDMPCGTGRLLRSLSEAGFIRLTGADYSPAMLERSRATAPAASVVRQDAFATDFPDASFDAIAQLRFLFHVEDAEKLFRETARLLRPGGVLVLDSIRWTPRGLVPPLDRRLGGRLWSRPDRVLEAFAERHGLAVVDRRRALALPSLAYRFVPAGLLAPLAALERRAPPVAFTKTFFAFRKRG